MNEQPLDLRRMLRALLRRWLLILAVLWAGCGAGYLIADRRPATYVARSSVLLPPSPVDADGDLTRNIQTQVNIARNGNILARAGRVVNPPLGPRTMRKKIKVKALSADILEVRAEARSAREAALLADAVAKEYVSEATDVSSKLASTAISGLVEQRASVEARLQQTTAEINAATGVLSSLPPNSPERARQAAIIDSLKLDEVEAARQRASMDDKIAEARLQDQLNRQGTSLLSPAIPPSRPSGPPALVFVIGGGLLGLVGSVLLSLVLDRRDGRLRRRADIADVVAAPVLASLETPRRVSAAQCRTMLERWEPRPLQSWALRQALLRLRTMHGEPPSDIVVVGLPGDVAGPVLALQIAVFTASQGTRTELVIATPDRTAARMRSACHRAMGVSEIRPYLSTSSEPVHLDEESNRAPGELTVSYVDAGNAELSSIPSGAITTLGVSSGFATSDTLAAAALACLDAGHPLAGIFLANPDPMDPTGGDPLGLPTFPFREQRPVLIERQMAAVGTGAFDPEEEPSDPVDADGHVAAVSAADEHAADEHVDHEHVPHEHVPHEHVPHEQVADEHVGDEQVGEEHNGDEQNGDEQVAETIRSLTSRLHAIRTLTKRDADQGDADDEVPDDQVVEEQVVRAHVGGRPDLLVDDGAGDGAPVGNGHVNEVPGGNGQVDEPSLPDADLQDGEHREDAAHLPPRNETR